MPCVEARLAIERTGDEGWGDFRTMLSWMEEGRIRPGPSSVFPFVDAPAGFHELLARCHNGKCVVVIN